MNTKILPVIGLSFLRLGGLGGCASETLPQPIIWTVCRAESETACNHQAFATEQPPLLLVGENLLPAVDIDLDHSRPVIGRAVVFSLGDVPIEITNSQSDSLLGQPSQGLPLGDLSAQVMTPSGGSAVLTHAFQVGDPLVLTDLVTEGNFFQVPVGADVRLKTTLTNLASVALLGTRIRFHQEGTGTFVLPAESEPQPVEPQNPLVISSLAKAQSAGTVQVTASAIANGPGSGLGPAERSLGLQIVAIAALEANLVNPLSSANVGQRFQLTVRLQNTGEAEVQDVAFSAPVLEGRITLVTEIPAARRLTGGSSWTTIWTFYAQAAGSASVTFAAQGSEIVSGRSVNSPALVHPFNVLQ